MVSEIRIQRNPNVEQISKQDLESVLKEATRHTAKGAYHKIHHGPRILSQFDVARVRKVAPIAISFPQHWQIGLIGPMNRSNPGEVYRTRGPRELPRNAPILGPFLVPDGPKNGWEAIYIV